MFLKRMMSISLNHQTFPQFEPPKIDEYDRPLKEMKAISYLKIKWILDNAQNPWMIESSSKGKAEVSAIRDGSPSSLFLVCQTICEVDLLPTGCLGSIFSSMEKETTCSWWPPSNRVIKSSLWPENVIESCCPTSKTQVSSGLFNTVNNKLCFWNWTYWGCLPTSLWSLESSSLSALTCLILYTSTRSWCRYSVGALQTKKCN